MISAVDKNPRRLMICKVIVVLVLLTTIIGLVSPLYIERNKKHKEREFPPHIIKLLAISAKNTSNDKYRAAPSSKPKENLIKHSELTPLFTSLHQERRASAISNSAIQKTVRKPSNIAAKGYRGHLITAPSLKKNKTKNDESNTANMLLNLPPMLINHITQKKLLTSNNKPALEYYQKDVASTPRIISTSTVISNQTKETPRTNSNKTAFFDYKLNSHWLLLANKNQLKQNIILDQAIYPTAKGKTHDFYCNKHFCYELDHQTGKKIYYTCDHSACKVIKT